MKTLLKNCLLRDGQKVDIRIAEGSITQVGPALETLADEKVKDLAGNLVTQGFVDCHLHLDKTLIALSTPNESGTLDEAIRITRQRKAAFTREEVKERARQTLDKAITNGTVAVRTNVDVDPIGGLIGLEALLELRSEYQGRIDIQIVAFPQEGIIKSPGTLELMAEALRMGADVVGGIPAKDSDPVEHIRQAFDLAERFSVPLDLHVDESDDPEDLTILTVAGETLSRGLQGKVTCAHCCSLAALTPDKLDSVLDKVVEAELNIVALPSTNLYLQGRKDEYRIRRGIAPVKALRAKGIRMALASDNVRDAFNPFGNANLLQISLLAAHGCHMGGMKELEEVYDMVTLAPREIISPDTIAGIKPGAKADLVVLPTNSAAQAIIEQVSIVERIKGGLQ